MNTRTPDMLNEIFKDPFRYYGGTYNIIVHPSPSMIGNTRELVYGLTAWNIESEKSLPEIYIRMKDLVGDKVTTFNSTTKQIYRNIRHEYAGKALVSEDIIQSAFPSDFIYGIVLWTFGKNDDIVHTFDDEDAMIDNIKVMKKLNENFRFRVFRNDGRFVEYFPSIYD